MYAPSRGSFVHAVSQKGWGCGVGVPCVLLDWEFNYFRKYTKEFVDYMKLCDKTHNGKKLPIDDYIKAMNE